MITPPIRSGRLAVTGSGLVLALVLRLGEARAELAFSTPNVTAVWPPTGIASPPWCSGDGICGRECCWAPSPTSPPTSRSTRPRESPWGTRWKRWWGRGCSIASAFARRSTGCATSSLLVLAALLSTAVSATIGVASLSVGDSLSEGALSTWRIWWLGDMAGDVLVASLIFVLVTHWPYRDLPGRAAEALVLISALVGIALVVFTHDAPAAFLTFPIIVWAGLRFTGAPASPPPSSPPSPWPSRPTSRDRSSAPRRTTASSSLRASPRSWA